MIALGVFSVVLAATLPVAVLLALNARKDRPVWQIAMDIPAAIALDLSLILVLSRVFMLDIASWVAKAVWLVIAVAVLAYRKRSGRAMPAWPRELTPKLLLRALLLGSIGLGVSLLMSRSCAIWDRQFHIPLTASLRGQTAPFVNVYEPWKTLFYHYGGDLYGATMQAYSFGILHASHTLSLIHDYCFFWLGFCVALVLYSAGQNRTFVAAVVLLAMLLSGPVTFLDGGKSRPSPYNLINFICLSFRPHVPLAILLNLPFIALPLVRLKELARDISLYDTLLPLAACTGLSMITDEFSVGALGFSLGVLWLFYPRVFAKTRKQGVIFFLGLALSMALATVVFKGTLAPGAPHYPLGLTTPGSPGYYQPFIPFTEARGRFLFFADLLPVLGVFAGGTLMLVRSRDTQFFGTFVAYAALTLLSILLFTTLVYQGTGLQNHRFITVPMVFGPMIASVWLLPRPENRSVISGFPGLLIMVAVGLGAATSFEWLAGGDAYLGCIDSGLGGRKFYDVDCRKETGSRLGGGKTETNYVEASLVYLYAGCRPTYVAGPIQNMDGHDLKQGIARMGLDALREIDQDTRFLKPDATAPVICPLDKSSDHACRMLRKWGACKPEGSELEKCTMTAEQRRSILGRR
jgi:hypothetical protein